jgi:nitrogen fixation/metabolism regulation signal transduction histidine kinase
MKIRLRAKLLLGFLSVGVITAILGILALNTYRAVGRELTKLQEDVVPGAINILESNVAILSVYKHLDDYLATGSETAQQHLSAAITSVRFLSRAHTEHETALPGDAGAIAVDMEERAASIISLADRALASESQVETDALEARIIEESQELEEIFDEHVAEYMSELEQVGAAVTAAHRTGTAIVWVALIIALGLSFALGYVVSNMIVNPLTHLITAADSISRGDLEMPIEVATGDELEDLAGAMERMRASIKAAVERLRRR